MKKKYIILFIIFFWLIVWNIFQYYQNKNLLETIHNLTPKDILQTNVEIWNDCQKETKIVQIDGSSMMPMIKNGDVVTIEYGYYQCENTITRWDIVIYESILTSGPIIKILRVLPWDRVYFENRNLYINGEVMKNSVWELYSFQDNQIKRISGYIQNWIFQEGSFLLFWDNISDSIDSRTYGALSQENFIGKVILK